MLPETVVAAEAEAAVLPSTLAAVRTLAEGPPLDPSVHVALAGVLAAARMFLERIEMHWSLVDEGTRAMWNRDRAILQVAQKARDARREAAWKSLR